MLQLISPDVRQWRKRQTVAFSGWWIELESGAIPTGERYDVQRIQNEAGKGSVIQVTSTHSGDRFGIAIVAGAVHSTYTRGFLHSFNDEEAPLEERLEVRLVKDGHTMVVVPGWAG